MKFVFTPEAEEQAEACDSWWRENRPSTRELFAEELADAKTLLMNTPNIGALYATLDGLPVRRVLMRKTGNQLYYVFDAEEDCIIVHSVWGGPKEHGPKL
jgi:plasmid stabilization system protein ParE